MMDGTNTKGGDKASRPEAELCLSDKVTQLVAPFDNHDHPQLGCTSLPRWAASSYLFAPLQCTYTVAANQPLSVQMSCTSCNSLCNKHLPACIRPYFVYLSWCSHKCTYNIHSGAFYHQWKVAAHVYPNDICLLPTLCINIPVTWIVKKEVRALSLLSICFSDDNVTSLITLICLHVRIYVL